MGTCNCCKPHVMQSTTLLFATLVVAASARITFFKGTDPSPTPATCANPYYVTDGSCHPEIFDKSPWCFGPGYYNPCQEVINTKCPQLNITNATLGNRTKDDSQYVLFRDGDFSDKTAVWYQSTVTGIGLTGYYYNYTAINDGGKYGWIQGSIPDHAYDDDTCCAKKDASGACLEATGTCPITVGMEILFFCTQSECGPYFNHWLQGNVVDPGLDALTFVVKPSNDALPLMAFTKLNNIRPLCFASAADYEAAATSTQYFPKKNHKQLTSFVEAGGLKQSSCGAFCQITIPSAGYNCPTSVSLNMSVVYSPTNDATKRDYNTFLPGNINAIFKPDKTQPDKLTFNVEYKQCFGPNNCSSAYANSGMFGPSLSDPTSPFLLPSVTSTATPKSFGQYVLAYSAAKSGAMFQTVFEGCILKNTPMQSSDKSYHCYTCQDKQPVIVPDPSSMRDTCWPSSSGY